MAGPESRARRRVPDAALLQREEGVGAQCLLPQPRRDLGGQARAPVRRLLMPLSGFPAFRGRTALPRWAVYNAIGAANAPAVDVSCRLRRSRRTSASPTAWARGAASARTPRRASGAGGTARRSALAGEPRIRRSLPSSTGAGESSTPPAGDAPPARY